MNISERTFVSLKSSIVTTVTDQMHEATMFVLDKGQGQIVDYPDQVIDLLRSILFKTVNAYEPRTNIENILDMTGLPLSGRLPGRLDLVAKGVHGTMDMVFELRKELDKLTDGEREVLLKQLPSDLQVVKAVLVKDWKPSRGLTVAHTISGVVVCCADKLGESGKAAIAYSAPIASKVSRYLVSSETQQAIQGTWDYCVKGTCNIGMNRLTSYVLDKAKQKLAVGGSIEHVLNFLTNQFNFLEEALVKIDSTLQGLPPSKILAASFLSMDEFSSLTLEAEKNFPKKIVKNAKLEQRYQLYHAAQQNALPASEINMAFRLICDPKDYGRSLREVCLALFQEKLEQRAPGVELLEQTNQKFKEFCVKHHLESQTPESLQLIKRAFFAKHLSLFRDNEGIFFLSDMILLAPQDYLGDQEILLEDFLKKASMLYLKRYLYPTIIDQFFPSDFDPLIKGLSKLARIDLHDLLSTAISVAIIEQGIECLRDPLMISKIVLAVLGGDVNAFADYRLGDGSSQQVKERFNKLLQCLGTRDYPEALQGLSLQPNLKRKDKVGKEVAGEIDKSVEGLINQHSLFIQLLVRPIGRDVGQVIAGLTQRKDFGMIILLTAGRLNQTFKDPVSAPELDLMDGEVIARVERIAQVMYPSAVGLLRTVRTLIPKFILRSHLKSKQDLIMNTKYSDHISLVENELLINHLTKRFIDSLRLYPIPFPRVESESLLRKGIHQAISQHVQETVEVIWGNVNSQEAIKYTKEYLQFLEEQETGELVSMIKRAALNPQYIRRKIIQRQENVLQSIVKRVDEMLLHPIPLPRVPLSLAVINQRLNLLELPVKLRQLQEALEGLWVARNNPYKNHSKEQLRAMITSTTEQMAAEEVVWENADERNQFLRLKEFIKLREEMANAQSGLSHLYAQEVDKASGQDLLEQRRKNVRKLKSSIERSEQMIKFLAAKKDSAAELAEKSHLEQLRARLENQQSFVDHLMGEMQKKAVRVKSLKAELRAKPVFTDLIKYEKELFDSLIGGGVDEENSSKILELRERIARLEEEARREIENFRKEESIITGNSIPSSVRNKFALVNMMLEEVHLEGQPTEQETLRDLRGRMKDLYQEILQLDFGFHLTATSQPKELIESFSHREALLEQTSQDFRVEIGNMDLRLTAITQQQREAVERMQQLGDLDRQLEDQIIETQSMASDIAVLEADGNLQIALLGVQSQKSIIAKNEELRPLRQALAAKEEEILKLHEARENSMGLWTFTIHRVKNLFIEDDPVIQELENQAAILRNQISQLEKHIEDEQSFILYSERNLLALERLKRLSGEQDFDRIKACYERRLIQDKESKEGLNREKKQISEKGKLLSKESADLKLLKQKKLERIEQISKQRQEIGHQIRCLKCLNAWDESSQIALPLVVGEAPTVVLTSKIQKMKTTLKGAMYTFTGLFKKEAVVV